MTIRTKFIVLSAAALLLVPLAAPLAYAKDLGLLKIKQSADINKDCGLEQGYDQISACYIQTLAQGDKAPAYTIYMRSDLPKELLPSVFLQQIGYFLTYDLTDAQIKQGLNPSPITLSVYDLHQFAASQFALWFLKAKMSPTADAFFRNLLSAR